MTTEQPSGSRRRTTWIIIITMILTLLGFICIAMLTSELRDRMIYRPPTQAEATRGNPEFIIANGRYNGIWGDFDRGGFIFEYADIDAPASLKLLLSQLTKAGWRILSEVDGEFVLERLETQYRPRISDI